jgi:hypothetical protein
VDKTVAAHDLLPELKQVQRILVAKNKAAAHQGPGTLLGKPAPGGLRLVGGLEAIKMLEQPTTVDASLPAPAPTKGVFASLAAMDDDDDDDDDENYGNEDADDAEDETDEDRALSVQVHQIEAEEAAAVAQAKRDERWERREMAREVLVTARLTEQQDRARQECLNFALPDAEDNDETPEAVQPHPSLGTRPAKKGAKKK